MSKQRRGEIISVVLLFVFIGFLFFQNSASTKSAKEVFEKVFLAEDLSYLKVRDNATLKKEFSFGEKDVENVLYVSSDSVMEVRELLLVEAKSKDDVDAIVEKIKSRVEEKKALFKNYAPEQSALLENYALQKKGKFIMFTVSDSPEKFVEAFKKAL